MSTDRRLQYSTLRVVRELEPTTELALFVEKVVDISLQTFGEKDQAFVKERAPLNVQLMPGQERMQAFNRIAISNAKIYPDDSLRLTLLERRSPTYANMRGSYARAKSWIQKKTNLPNAVSEYQAAENALRAETKDIVPEAGLIENRDPLAIFLVSAERSLNADYSFMGPEYALRLRPDAVTEYLCDEADFIYGVARSMPRSTRVVYPQAHSNLEVPFARAPFNSTYDQRAEFIGRVIDECLPIKGILGPIIATDVSPNDKTRPDTRPETDFRV